MYFSWHVVITLGSAMFNRVGRVPGVGRVTGNTNIILLRFM